MNERSIFLAAVEIGEPAARAAYLDQACHCDPALRRGVEDLLAAHGRSGSFMGRPAAGEATADYKPVAERPGTVLGPYKLMEQIGEGGTGLVFVAEQQHPVRRKVALKIIKPGMDSQQVIARFEAERQALALMDYQNIAKVFDAGTTESGRPYFVMELVYGIPITDFCDANKLTPRERLELFLPVCHAIQHAHQKGIIHRDIKPSNILVTMYDDKPVPKVIDFGVDTRSDVYALGVLLYELLTGTTPLQRHRLREAAYADIVRLIKEEEPPPPSTRLSSSGAALTNISQQRGSAPGQLTELVRGELDWIVMRCLEKDRTRRYETANGLARDVERYLYDEPVEACPPTAGYKLRKFARKHKMGLATAAGFAALLLLGVAANAWQAVRATQAEHQANANAAQANQQRDEARALAEKLQVALEQLRRTTYTAQINLAQHAWEAGATDQVVDLLEQQRPKPGENDLRGFEWDYLYQLSHAEILRLNSGSATSVAYSPDGKRLASAGEGVKVWDAQTGHELLSLKGRNGDWTSGSSVAFSPDGKHLASTWDDAKQEKDYTAGEVKVWDAQTGRELLSIKGDISTFALAFSPDGKRLASADDKKVKVWDAQTGQEVLTFNGHINLVTSLAFSPDGKRLAGAEGSGGNKPRDVKVWDAQTGQELLSLKGHTRWVGDIAFSPDGKRLAGGAVNGTVTIWGATALPEKP